MSAVIRLEKLNKRFGGIVVADQIDLEIHPGEILGLIGPNGAGKTSLFNLITGFVPLDSGSITFLDKQISKMPIYRRARMGISRTWQNIRLFQSNTVLDNLLIGPRIYEGESLFNQIFRPGRLKRAREKAMERAMILLRQIGLEEVRDLRVSELPHGQQKLVGLARAMMNDGGCLLLDEPMAGVEGQAYETMRKVIIEAAEGGKAVCVVEHNISFIKDLCTRAVFMFNGKIIARGTVDELIQSKELTEMYFGGDFEAAQD